MKTLNDALLRAGRQPRACPWTITYRFGHGGGAAERPVSVIAAPGDTRLVLSRVHNGILLLQPASVHIAGPRELENDPILNELGLLHRIPIGHGDVADVLLPDGSLDLPGRESHEPSGEAGLAGRAVGLDIGGTAMKACALGPNGQVLASARALTWPEGERGIDSLVDRGRALVNEVAEGEPVASLGVGFASPMGLGARITGLSTVMRDRLGEVDVLADLCPRLAQGITRGPTALFNDLANLGRDLSGQGRRRMLRLQIGTSFGGCWIDADGTVNYVELGRLIVDASPTARPHTYLPIRGAMKSYLSGYGVGLTLAEELEHPVSAWDSGFELAKLLRAGDPRGLKTVTWMAELLVGVIHEASAVLGGLREVEVGGSMLQGVTGARLRAQVDERLSGLDRPPEFRVARDPGFDGAVAAARAPGLKTPLRGMRRVRS